MDNKYLIVLDKQIEQFLQQIASECSINSKKLHVDKTDFPIFSPANPTFFEYKHFEDTLEWYIRRYLVTPVFTKWFSISGYHCTKLKSKSNRLHFKYSNESYGDDFLFAFTVEKNGKKIAYRYSGLCLEKAELHKYLRKYNIDHFEIIDWSDTESNETNQVNSGVPVECRKRAYYITLYHFLRTYFTNELADSYVEKVKNAVNEANQMIGFQTIPVLSLKHLSLFKTSSLSELQHFELEKTHYVEFNSSGELTSTQQPLLNQADYQVIRKRCFEDKLMHALSGSEKFAKCFMTSEYLFSLFKSGKQHYFDYSTIVSGYFKSVEILLEKLVLQRLETPGHETLWIKAKNGRRGYSGPIDGTNCRKNPITNEKQVLFIESNRRFFSNEMGPLIWFIHDDVSQWHISATSKDIIHNCLINYSMGCRNEHLHKDIIDDVATIKAVRNNTILCLLYLLGGRIISSSSNEDYRILSALGDSYERLYKEINRIPKSICVFYLQFTDKPVQRVIRLYDQTDVEYNDSGNIISVIKFVKAAEPTSDDLEFSTKKETDFADKDIIVLSPNNIPDRIWRYNRSSEKKEVIW